jgi:5-methyltetrahydrofolate--homocysteine methyltransferase
LLWRGVPVSETTKQSPYLAELERRVLIFDGAMGTSLDEWDLTAEDFGGEATNGCRDYLVITRPDIIEQVHTSSRSSRAAWMCC